MHDFVSSVGTIDFLLEPLNFKSESHRFVALRDHMIERYLSKMAKVCDWHRMDHSHCSETFGVPCEIVGCDCAVPFASTVSDFRDLFQTRWGTTIVGGVEEDPLDMWDIDEFVFDDECVEWCAVRCADCFVRDIEFDVREQKPLWMTRATAESCVLGATRTPRFGKWTRKNIHNLCCYCLKIHKHNPCGGLPQVKKVIEMVCPIVI